MVTETVHFVLLSIRGREHPVFRWNGHEPFSFPTVASAYRLPTSLDREPRLRDAPLPRDAEKLEKVDSSTKFPPGLYAPGNVLAPGASVTSFEKTTSGRLIYSVPIHVDRFGRRATVNTGKSQR